MSLQNKPRDGPLPEQERSCTDIFCCLLFIIFTGLSIGAGVYGFMNGDPSKLSLPYDPDGQQCGGPQREGFPYIYFANPTTATLWRTVCVSSCPTAANSPLACKPNKVVTDCNSHVSSDPTAVTLIYPTEPIFGKICMPISQDLIDKVTAGLGVGGSSEYMNDLKASQQIILASALLSIILGFLFLVIIKSFGICIIWFIIILIVALFGVLGLGFLALSTNQDWLTAHSQQPLQFQIIGLILASFSLVLLIVCICIREKINLAARVIEVAAAFITENKTILCIPVFLFIVCFGYLVYWLTASTYLYSCGTVSTAPHNLPFGSFEFDDNLIKIGYFQIFALFWNMQFLVLTASFVTVGTAGFWYYCRNDKNQPSFTLTSLKYALRYHIGTIAFGSLLIALLNMVRAICAYITYKVKNTPAGDNTLVKCLLGCLNCFVCCFEKCLNVITRDSLIYTFMDGNNFCTAGKNVCELISSNITRIALISGFGYIIEFLGVLGISTATTFACYEFITKIPEISATINNPLIPSAAIFIISIIFSTYFVGILCDSADSLIVYYCYDEKDNGQISDKCPDELRKYVNTHPEMENQSNK